MAASTVHSRPSTRATARMIRMSASKARVVLNLIRGKHVNEAMEILSFSERLAAEPISKCLVSAVSNAQHNEDLSADELFVSACYADEGPTLKRYRPRARGRAGRIHKQTCHITVEVSRYTEDELDEMRSREAARSEGRQDRSTARSSGEDRARRVARSRAAQAADEAPADEVDETPADEVDETPTDAADETPTDAAEAPIGSDDADTETETDDAETETDDTEDTDEVATDEVAAEEEAGDDAGDENDDSDDEEVK